MADNFLPWTQLATDPAYAAGTFVGDVARGAASTFCQFIQKFPQWATQTLSGAFPLQAGYVSAWCGSNSPATAPHRAPKVAGGQCKCVRYNMHVDATFHGTRVVFTDYIYGAVGGIAWTKNDYGNWNFDIYGLASDCVTPRQINVVNNFSDSYYQAGDFDFAELTLTRVDGLPDNCGDTLGALTPQAPGDGDYNKVLPVADPSGSGTLNLPFKVTLPPVSVSLPPVILDPLPVVLAPTLNLAVSFSLGGLTFNYYAGGDNPQHPFPPPSGQPSPPSQPAPPSDSRIGQILTNTNLLTTCGYDPCMHTKQTNVQVGSSFSFECPTGYYITSVLIHTSSYPSNTRVQSGGGVAPNIYYLGWYAFGYGDVGGDRLPISYLDQTVAPCAHGATGFSATLYSGCTGTATVFYQNDHS